MNKLENDINSCLKNDYLSPLLEQLLEEYFEKLIEKELPECVKDLKDSSTEDQDGAKKAKVL